MLALIYALEGSSEGAEWRSCLVNYPGYFTFDGKAENRGFAM